MYHSNLKHVISSFSFSVFKRGCYGLLYVRHQLDVALVHTQRRIVAGLTCTSEERYRQFAKKKIFYFYSVCHRLL